MENVTLPDGRTLDYLVYGPDGGVPLVLHHGTPSAAVGYEPLIRACVDQGLRLVLPTRAGYGSSTPHPGRRVADVASDTAALLDRIGAGEFVTAGWSGGGPHALACGALLPDRCRAVATIAGVAPYRGYDGDWLDGMGEENVAEFGAAVEGVNALNAFLEPQATALANVQPDEIVQSFGDLISEVDKQALVGGFAEYLAESFRTAIAQGYAGWRDDDLAFVDEWGFALTDIQVPVSLWQGDQDRMVPFSHGKWLSTHIPTATAHLLPGEGHLSLIDNFTTIATTLRASVA